MICCRAIGSAVATMNRMLDLFAMNCNKNKQIYNFKRKSHKEDGLLIEFVTVTVKNDNKI